MFMDRVVEERGYSICPVASLELDMPNGSKPIITTVISFGFNIQR